MLVVTRKRPVSLSHDDANAQKKAKEIAAEQLGPIETGLILRTGNYTYAVGEVIGSGGFGTVYTAKEMYGDREFALKVLENKTEKQMKRNREEVSVLTKTTRSEFLLSFEAAFTYAKEQVCILMEKMDIDLFDYVTENLKQKPMRLPLLRKILKQIVMGVSALHAIGIVHCDLKLENVMIVNRRCTTDPWRIKIIDYGNHLAIDRIRQSYGIKVQNTQYRAPEIMFGLPASEKLDIWSVGVLALELYTSFQLINGNTEWQAICQYSTIFDFPENVRDGRNFVKYLNEVIDQNGFNYVRVKPFYECEPGVKYASVVTRTNYPHRGLSKIIQYGFNHHHRGSANELDVHFLHLVNLLCIVNERERISAADALRCQFFN